LGFSCQKIQRGIGAEEKLYATLKREGSTAVEDNILVRDFINLRNEVTFKALMKSYEDKVRGLAYHMLGNLDEAKEATLVIFEKVFFCIDQFKGKCKFSTWLYRVTVNHCFNELKHKRCRKQIFPRSLDDWGEDMSVKFANPFDLEKKLDKKDMEQRIHKIVQSLSPKLRKVIVLADIYDCSHKEIATIMDCPVGTVKSRHNRARNKVRERIEKLVAYGIR